jgi:hypothetical protein
MIEPYSCYFGMGYQFVFGKFKNVLFKDKSQVSFFVRGYGYFEGIATAE